MQHKKISRRSVLQGGAALAAAAALAGCGAKQTAASGAQFATSASSASHVIKETSVMGVVNLAQQCANLLIPFVSLGVSGSIIRFGLDKGCSKKQVFTNGLLTIFLGYAIMRPKASARCMWPSATFKAFARLM